MLIKAFRVMPVVLLAVMLAACTKIKIEVSSETGSESGHTYNDPQKSECTPGMKVVSYAEINKGSDRDIFRVEALCGDKVVSTITRSSSGSSAKMVDKNQGAQTEGVAGCRYLLTIATTEKPGWMGSCKFD